MAQLDLSTSRGVYEQRDEIQIVDVREQMEWDAGRIEGSRHIPLNQLMAGAGDDLDPATPVVVVCRSGNRSELGALMLQARGYQAHNLRGGVEEWEQEGLPFTTPDGQPGRVV